MSRRSLLKADFSLQHILNGGDREFEAEHFADGSSFDKACVSRISLKLHPEV